MFKSLHTLVLATLLSFTLPALVQVNATLPANVQRVLQTNKLTSNGLSLVLIPLDGSDNPTCYNADTSMNLASITKLFTIYAALGMLGPAYQWKTEFYTDGQLRNGTPDGDLYLEGGGDPKLNMEKLWLLMCDLCANGVAKVTDDLVLDHSYFNIPQLPASSDDGDDDTKPLLVGPDLLLVNLKNVRVMMRTDGNKVNVRMDPPLASVRIDSQVRMTVPVIYPAWPRLRFSPVAQFDDTTLLVTGRIPQGCSAQTYMSLLNHPSYTAGAVCDIWQELGGNILGKDRQGSVPHNATLIAKASSPDLVKIIHDINKYSNDTMARQLFLSIDAQFRNSADGNDTRTAQRVVWQ